MATEESIRNRLQRQHLERRNRRQRMPKPTDIRKFQRSHTARLLSIVTPYQEIVERELFPLLDIIVSEAGVRLDDHIDIINETIRKIREESTSSTNPAVMARRIQDTAWAIDGAGRDLFNRQFKTVFSVNPIAAEPWLEAEVKAFVAENASLISTLPGESLSDIEQMVFRDARRGLSPQVIRANILKQFNITEARAQLIARDQVSKFNGRLTELRQKQSGITRYIWRDSEDGRVRTFSNTSGTSDHARLSGETFSWDDPPVTIFKGKRAGERNHPGEDIQCRCYAEPVIEDLL